MTHETPDADAGRAGAEDHHALPRQRDAGLLRAGEERRDRHRGRPLDVVVERRQDVAIALEVRERRALLEILPLEEGLGEAPAHGVDELVDQLVVRGAAQPGVPPPDVEVVVQQGLVVGADVEADRQRRGRMDAGGRRVERELADGDAHAARALVAQPEDALVVRDDDEAHVVVRDIGQHRLDAPAMIGRDPDAAGAPEDPAVLAAGFADGRRVDDGQELVQVFEQDAEEQVLVAILQGRQPDVALQRIGLPHDVGVGAGSLLLHGADHGRQQPLELELATFLDREGGRLVVEVVAQQAGTPLPDPDADASVRGRLETIRFHAG